MNNSTQVRAINLYSNAKRNGLSDLGARPQGKTTINNYYSTSSSSGSSGSSTLSTIATIAGIAGIVGAGASIFSMASKGSSGAQQGGFSGSGVQGGGQQATSKELVSTLQTAENSTNPDAIQKTIDQGQTESDKVGQQIKSTTDQANTAKTDMDNAQNNVNQLEKTTIPNQEKELEGLKGQVKGENSSSGLTGKRDSEIQAIPKTVAGPDGKQIDNPELASKTAAIKAKYDPQIEKAKKIENEDIPRKQKEIDASKDKLKTTKEVLADKKKA